MGKRNQDNERTCDHCSDEAIYSIPGQGVYCGRHYPGPPTPPPDPQPGR